jgi:DNA-binding NtrC family response regulator
MFAKTFLLLGLSAAMGDVVETIERLAPSSRHLLLYGERGVGKTGIARVIHERSPRKSAAFVPCDIPTKDEHLVLDDLLGHGRGAFTGAARPRKGLVEEAHRGTLFLDEIGLAGSALQHLLLALLERSLVRPLGAERDLSVDVRIIAATNQDLHARVRLGAFPADVLDRFGPFVITVPPLRERREEILALATHFVAREAGGFGRMEPPPLSRDVLNLFAVAPWWGNVRELELECAWATLWCGDRARIEVDDLSPIFLGTLGRVHRRRARHRALGPRQVEAALALAGGNRTKAAQLLGVDRRQVQRILKEGRG